MQPSHLTLAQISSLLLAALRVTPGLGEANAWAEQIFQNPQIGDHLHSPHIANLSLTCSLDLSGKYGLATGVQR